MSIFQLKGRWRWSIEFEERQMQGFIYISGRVFGPFNSTRWSHSFYGLSLHVTEAPKLPNPNVWCDEAEKTLFVLVWEIFDSRFENTGCQYPLRGFQSNANPCTLNGHTAAELFMEDSTRFASKVDVGSIRCSRWRDTPTSILQLLQFISNHYAGWELWVCSGRGVRSSWKQWKHQGGWYCHNIHSNFI